MRMCQISGKYKLHKKRRRGRDRVTLFDVAKQVGVSPMTVSRVIGGHVNVSDAMRAKVTAGIRRLGYFPDAAARALAGAGSFKIGLLYGYPSSTFTGEFLIALSANIDCISTQLVLEKCTTLRSQLSTARALVAAAVDGVLLPAPLCDSLVLLRQFEELGIPTVAVGTSRRDLPGLSLRIDNVRAAREMTRYLLSLGHRNIGFILGRPRQINSVQLYEGFTTALKEAVAPVRSKIIKPGDNTYRAGLLAAEQLFKGRDRPTAIIAGNDAMAAGAMATALRLNLRVPQDLTIVALDDTPLATAVWPSLTTVHQPTDELARLALTILVEEIRRRRSGEAPARRQEVVTLRLVKRRSAPRA